MNEVVARDTSLTVRLATQERADLEALAEQWQLDKSAAIRRALQLAVSGRQHLPHSGYFVALPPQAVTFKVRLSGKGEDGG